MQCPAERRLEKAYRRGLQKAWRPQVQVEFFEADDDRSDCDDAVHGSYVSKSYVNFMVGKRTVSRLSQPGGGSYSTKYTDSVISGRVDFFDASGIT